MNTVDEDRWRKAGFTLRYRCHEKVTELRMRPECATFGRMRSFRMCPVNQVSPKPLKIGWRVGPGLHNPFPIGCGVLKKNSDGCVKYYSFVTAHRKMRPKIFLVRKAYLCLGCISTYSSSGRGALGENTSCVDGNSFRLRQQLPWQRRILPNQMAWPNQQ